MKILYDGSIYSYQAAGGVNNYIAKIIDLMPQEVHSTLAVNVRRDVNFPTKDELDLIYFKRFCFRPGRLCFLVERFYFRSRMLKRNYDIFHPSLYGENLAQVPISSFKCPLVVTVHDMIDEIYPEVDPTGVRRQQKLECIRLAKAIICVSENTKSDLLNRHPEVDHKVHVIPNGCNIDTSDIKSREFVPVSPYFLFVGGRKSDYKNFDSALKTMAVLAGEFPTLKIVVAGAAINPDEKSRIEALGLSKKVISFENPDERLLARLYHWSVCLLYPSIYEGFGIPPLEAMACGTCVIAADRSSIPEVVGNAGLLFNPDEPDGLVKVARRVLEDPALRDDLIRKGKERVQSYSWHRSAAATFEVYKSVCVGDNQS